MGVRGKPSPEAESSVAFEALAEEPNLKIVTVFAVHVDILIIRLLDIA